jgi:hypothetical protein
VIPGQHRAACQSKGAQHAGQFVRSGLCRLLPVNRKRAGGEVLRGGFQNLNALPHQR